MGEYDAETTTYSALAGGAGASPWMPDFNGKLLGLRVIVGSDAVTTLTELIQFKLTCTAWKPNSIEAVGIGNGLRTAPAAHQAPVDHVCDQPIKSGVSVTLEARNVTADTPVTVSAIIMGYFEV